MGSANDGAGDGDSLFLSSGKLAWIVLHPVGKAYDRERRLDMLAPLGFRQLRKQQRQFDILKGS